MALRIYTMSYGSPGDVENIRVVEPKTLTEWCEKAKEALSNSGGFIICNSQGVTLSGSPETEKKKISINVEAVEWVAEVE